MTCTLKLSVGLGSHLVFVYVCLDLDFCVFLCFSLGHFVPVLI